MLPAVHTDEELSAVVGDETILRPAAADLAARHGLAGRELRRYPAGSSPVCAVGDQHVIKLYPALPGYNGAAETRVLEFLQGRWPVATPELHAHGEYENGWHFILMSQLPGEDLAKTWPEVPLDAQDRIADEVGGLLAGLHALDPGPLTGLIGPENGAAFLVEQRATAVERQRQVRLGDLVLAGLGRDLDGEADLAVEARDEECPSRSHNSSATCGASGATIRTSGSARARGRAGQPGRVRGQRDELGDRGVEPQRGEVHPDRGHGPVQQAGGGGIQRLGRGSVRGDPDLPRRLVDDQAPQALQETVHADDVIGAPRTVTVQRAHRHFVQPQRVRTVGVTHVIRADAVLQALAHLPGSPGHRWPWYVPPSGWCVTSAAGTYLPRASVKASARMYP